jgi:hypothetical protein
MKKSAVFLILSFILLGFFACHLAIPTAIEIIGSPSPRFAETVDIGKMFTDLLRDAMNKDERLTIIPCTEPEIITYLIHTKLLDNQEFNELESEEHFYESFPHSQDDKLYDHILDGSSLGKDKVLFSLDSSEEAPENRLIVPFSELGSLLPGFQFYHGEDKDGNKDDPEGVYKTRLYISGSKIVEKSKIIITIGKFEFNEEEDKEEYKKIDDFTIEKDDIITGESDIYKWEAEGYSDKDFCPLKGADVDIPITKEDIVISFKILIPKNEYLNKDDFEECKINVELVVWLPFKFIAVEDDAALSFPEGSFFSSEDDLFGREKPDSESLMLDIIESLSVDVRFYNNPFKGAELIISNKKDIEAEEKGINIPSNSITDDSLSFTLTEENMKEINNPDNWPFVPDIKIGFAPGDKLTFPKVFNAIEFAFKTKVRYRIDL